MLISNVPGEKLVVDVGVDGSWDESNDVGENGEEVREGVLYVHHFFDIIIWC